MLDPLSITLISKALDFLLDEAHNLINEKRKQKESSKAIPEDLTKTKEYKDALLKKGVKEQLFEDSKTQLEHLIRKAQIHQKSYHLLSEQSAQFGLYVPPHIANSRDDEKRKLVGTLIQIKEIVENILGEEINIQGIDLLTKDEDG
jgi:hypothetical protein